MAIAGGLACQLGINRVLLYDNPMNDPPAEGVINVDGVTVNTMRRVDGGGSLPCLPLPDSLPLAASLSPSVYEGQLTQTELWMVQSLLLVE